MLASIFGKIFLVCISLGVLALLPMIFINRKTSDKDSSIYKKGFSARAQLKNFENHESDKETKADKKLKSYKL